MVQRQHGSLRTPPTHKGTSLLFAFHPTQASASLGTGSAMLGYQGYQRKAVAFANKPTLIPTSARQFSQPLFGPKNERISSLSTILGLIVRIDCSAQREQRTVSTSLHVLAWQGCTSFDRIELKKRWCDKSLLTRLHCLFSFLSSKQRREA